MFGISMAHTVLVYGAALMSLLQLSCDLNDDSVSEQLRQENVWWQHYVSELL